MWNDLLLTSYNRKLIVSIYYDLYPIFSSYQICPFFFYLMSIFLFFLYPSLSSSYSPSMHVTYLMYLTLHLFWISWSKKTYLALNADSDTSWLDLRGHLWMLLTQWLLGFGDGQRGDVILLSWDSRSLFNSVWWVSINQRSVSFVPRWAFDSGGFKLIS